MITNLQIFQPGKLGPLQLRNKSIRSAAFEGMAYNNSVSEDLIAYHRSVAKGGIGMSTVAYAATGKSGLSFPHQLLLREEIKGDLRRLTDAIHQHGAAASIQLGHCGNMANKQLTGLTPVAPTGGINLYGPTFPRTINKRDMAEIIEEFKKAIILVYESGFDAVEIHAGHGYLISQFLSPYTNKRKDEYGGSFENRKRFMVEVLSAVRDSMPSSMAMIVKMNSWDGFKSGITKEEGILSARAIEQCGADALVVSGGFVSRAPMYVMRGRIPTDIMAYYIKEGWKKFFVKLMGNQLIKREEYSEGFFMEDAGKIKDSVKIPVILVGGLNSIETIEKAEKMGFEYMAFARALIENPNYINELREGLRQKSDCTICNYCVAKMYTEKMTCQFHEQDIPSSLKRKIEKLNHG